MVIFGEAVMASECRLSVAKILYSQDGLGVVQMNKTVIILLLLYDFVFPRHFSWSSVIILNQKPKITLGLFSIS